MNPITTIYLEMTDAAQLRPKIHPDPRFRIMETTTKQWQFNRFLYAYVGAQWAWHDKLTWTDERWRSYLEDGRRQTFTAYFDGSVAGYFELFDVDSEVEIAYFGLAPPFIAKGLGGALLTRALEEAWRTKPKRVWVHTCSLDHAYALKNYEDRGMVVYKTEILQNADE